MINPKMYASARQELFAREYVANGFKEVDAYMAIYRPGVEARPAHIASVAKGLLKNPKVAARVAELRKAVVEEVTFDAVAVLREWVTIATADSGELVKVRQICCRHCWGVGGNYQWRNADELARAQGEWLDDERRKFIDKPSDAGGFGYMEGRPPRHDCTHCAGEGTTDVFITPTDRLSRQGRKLYAGAKLTKNGIEIMMRSQDKALENIARALGMLTPANDPNAPGRPGRGDVVDVPAMPVDPVEASRTYLEFMKNS